ncbi:MAG: acetyltransferase [Propionibacteriaceae bacterium]|nr:acetyltransferase [Propionibacteriaceae bacterium]
MIDPVVIIGIAGFGRETADVADATRTPIAGFVDDFPSQPHLDLVQARGVPFLGTVDEWLSRTPGGASYVIGIGNGRIREHLADKLDRAGHVARTMVHPSATMGFGVDIGAGSVICAGVCLSNSIRLGRHTTLNPNSTIGHDTVLDDFVSINPTANVSGAVHVGARTLIGAGATVLQNLTVGADVTVGAVALVTKNVPDGVTVVGIPGRWKDPA